MAPKGWTDKAQLAWLEARKGKYLDSKSAGDQIEFFTRLDEEWFAVWPEEEYCRIPSKESGETLSEEQTATLAAALDKRKNVSKRVATRKKRDLD